MPNQLLIIQLMMMCIAEKTPRRAHHFGARHPPLFSSRNIGGRQNAETLRPFF